MQPEIKCYYTGCREPATAFLVMHNGHGVRALCSDCEHGAYHVYYLQHSTLITRNEFEIRCVMEP